MVAVSSDEQQIVETEYFYIDQSAIDTIVIGII